MTDNEANERLRAWHEGCLSCRHWKETFGQHFCHAGHGVAVHTRPTLFLVDVGTAARWASESDHLWNWSWYAAAAFPQCPHYQRPDP